MRFRGLVYPAHNPQWSWTPLSGEGARRHGGRFNQRRLPALYTSLIPLAAIREAQPLGRPMQPLTLCAYEVDAEPVLDALDEERRRALGVLDSHLLRRGDAEYLRHFGREEGGTRIASTTGSGRVQHRHAGRLEVPHVSSHHRQTVLQRRRRDQQIGAFMAEGAPELAPPTRRGQVDGENSFSVQREHTVPPCGQHSGKRRVTVPLAYDFPLDLADGHHAAAFDYLHGR